MPAHTGQRVETLALAILLCVVTALLSYSARTLSPAPGLSRIAFPLLTIVLVWLWGRRLFGPLGGLAAASVFALEPVSLGFGPLAHTHHAAALAYTGAWYCAWRMWGEKRWSWAAGAAAGLLGFGWIVSLEGSAEAGRLYFIIAPLLKASVASLSLASLGIAFLRRQRSTLLWLLAPIAVAVLIAWALGYQEARFLLIALPFVALLCGAAAQRLGRVEPVLLIALLWVLVAETTGAYPHGTSFVNALGGKLPNAALYLTRGR